MLPLVNSCTFTATKFLKDLFNIPYNSSSTRPESCLNSNELRSASEAENSESSFNLL